MKSKYFQTKNKKTSKHVTKEVTFDYTKPVSPTFFNSILVQSRGRGLIRKEKEKKNKKTITDTEDDSINKKEVNLFCKYKNIEHAWNKYQELINKNKMQNEELSNHITCEYCNEDTNVKKGKYGNYLICKACCKHVSKNHIDHFIFNEKERTFFKKRKRISFEIEQKNKFRIHSFETLQFGSELNQMISQTIKEIISDLRKIKKVYIIK